jgi:peptidyl serine alpha-galactosyltransferase
MVGLASSREKIGARRVAFNSHWHWHLLIFGVLGWCLLQWLIVWTVDTESAVLGDLPHDMSVASSHAEKVPGNKHTVVDESIITRANDNKQSDAHHSFQIVFSTDCSDYQHWQGILLYYSAVRIQQPGTITRIASGCTLKQQETIASEWRHIDPTEKRFLVHFAPSTTLQNEKYKYSNKPGGILHWLEHNERLQQLSLDTVVCLLDPDMILLKPISSLLIDPTWQSRPHGRHQIEYVDPATGIAQRLRVQSLPGLDDDQLPIRVTTGYPAGQHFGVGGAWVQGQTASAKPTWKNFSKAFVCGVGSDKRNAPCTRTSAMDASQLYAVGPVYLATIQDWKRIAATWMDFVPRVHQQYPYLLAEMYAMTMAFANLELPFSLFSSYMITGVFVDSATESWSWIDDLFFVDDMVVDDPIRAVCEGVNTFRPPTWSHSSPALPNTLHYCDRYKMDFNNIGQEESSFLFGKHRIPHNVFSCDNSDNSKTTVPFDIHELIRQASSNNSSGTKTQRRTLFAFCQLVPLLNWARRTYQEQVCGW